MNQSEKKHQEKITVYRDGKDFFVQSSFSETLDIIVNIWYNPYYGMPNESSFLVPKGSCIDALLRPSPEGYPGLHDYPVGGEMLHRGTDEFPAYLKMGEYAVLGGNHGSAFGRILTIPKHEMDTSELGAEITDDKDVKYYILSIPDEDHIIIHPSGKKYGYPEFTKLEKGQKIHLRGNELKYSDMAIEQVKPSNRVTEDILLVDGKTPLLDRTVVECSFLDHIFEYEIVMPEARVEMFKKAPGIKHDFIDPSLPALMRIHFKNHHQRYGACVINITNTVLHEFPSYCCLGVMMCWGTDVKYSGNIGAQKRTEFYIPKLKPLKATLKDRCDTLDFDFASVADLPYNERKKVNYIIQKSNCIDPEDPPDRFIRLTGDGNKRKYGVALGYSLFEGMTAKENKGKYRSELYILASSRKIYPLCCTIENPKVGDVRHITAYRQYFDPQREPDATNFYWNRQGDSDIVYLDFHKNLENKKITLPEYMSDKKITVVEKTPSVKLFCEEVLHGNTIKLSVSGNYGYVVLKLNPLDNI